MKENITYKQLHLDAFAGNDISGDVKTILARINNQYKLNYDYYIGNHWQNYTAGMITRNDFVYIDPRKANPNKTYYKIIRNLIEQDIDKLVSFTQGVAGQKNEIVCENDTDLSVNIGRLVDDHSVSLDQVVEELTKQYLMADLCAIEYVKDAEGQRIFVIDPRNIILVKDPAMPERTLAVINAYFEKNVNSIVDADTSNVFIDIYTQEAIVRMYNGSIYESGLNPYYPNIPIIVGEGKNSKPLVRSLIEPQDEINCKWSDLFTASQYQLSSTAAIFGVPVDEWDSLPVGSDNTLLITNELAKIQELGGRDIPNNMWAYFKDLENNFHTKSGVVDIDPNVSSGGGDDASILFKLTPTINRVNRIRTILSDCIINLAKLISDVDYQRKDVNFRMRWSDIIMQDKSKLGDMYVKLTNNTAPLPATFAMEFLGFSQAQIREAQKQGLNNSISEEPKEKDDKIIDKNQENQEKE